MEELITSSGGWDYFTGGTAISPTGEYYFAGEKVWSPPAATPYAGSSGVSVASGSSGSSEWVNNLGSLFGYAGKTYADTWAAKTMMQTSQNGQRYVEGQRIQAMQGGFSPLLLIGLGVVAFMALKD